MVIRIVTIAAGENNIEEFFQYELTREPMSLFRNGMMRKPDQAALRKVIMPKKNVIKKEDITKCGTYVIDGGALLHRVRWSKDMKFNAIAETYVKYVTRHYDDSIVFDGYCTVLSLMAMTVKVWRVTSTWRGDSVPQSSTVNINGENHILFTQDCFLSNTENKFSLIAFLSLHLKRRGLIVINCPVDADAAIVKNALRYAKWNSKIVIVVPDDTNVVVMLVHHWKAAMQDIYFLKEWWNKAWSVKNACTRNVAIKEHLLFLHSWSGCDSTSVVFGKGKPKVAQMLAKSNK